MSFVKTVLLSLLNFTVFSIIVIVLLISVLQRKFPPSLEQAGRIADFYSNSLESHTDIRKHIDIENVIELNKILSSRKQLEEQLAKLDTGMRDLSAKQEAKEKMQAASLANKDWNTLKIRIEQSEQKIKFLEQELTLLKNSIKQEKLKN